MFHSELCWWLVDGAPLGSQRAANPQTRRFSIFLVCPARRPNFLMWSRMLIALAIAGLVNAHRACFAVRPHSDASWPGGSGAPATHCTSPAGRRL